MKRLLNQKQAIAQARKILDGMGYVCVGGGGGTSYYGKRGMMHRKVRVSDHPYNREGLIRLDLLTHIVFDGPTTEYDVAFRVRKAHELFEAEQRNLARK